ncbi:MAG: hypothetical protein ABI627_09765 [Polyangiaceae bacterium]
MFDPRLILSVPFELRLLLARDPTALTAVGRIFVQENDLPSGDLANQRIGKK